MNFKFKQEKTVNERKIMCEKFKSRYPGVIPIIIEKDPNANITVLDETQFAIEHTLTAGHLILMIKKRMKMKKGEALSLLVNGKTVITGSDSLSDIYEKYKDKEDGYLYIVYTSSLFLG